MGDDSGRDAALEHAHVGGVVHLRGRRETRRARRVPDRRRSPRRPGGSRCNRATTCASTPVGCGGPQDVALVHDFPRHQHDERDRQPAARRRPDGGEETERQDDRREMVREHRLLEDEHDRDERAPDTQQPHVGACRRVRARRAPRRRSRVRRAATMIASRVTERSTSFSELRERVSNSDPRRCGTRPTAATRVSDPRAARTRARRRRPRARPRQRGRTAPRRHSQTASGTTAATTTGLVASAAPNSTPVRTARHQRGSSRYTSAAQTASAVRAAAGPSPVICPVVHSIVPVVATSRPAHERRPYASRPAGGRRPRSRSRRRSPASSGVRRGRVDRVEAEDVARVQQRKVERALATRRGRGTGGVHAACRRRWRRRRRRRTRASATTGKSGGERRRQRSRATRGLSAPTRAAPHESSGSPQPRTLTVRQTCRVRMSASAICQSSCIKSRPRPTISNERPVSARAAHLEATTAALEVLRQRARARRNVPGRASRHPPCRARADPRPR